MDSIGVARRKFLMLSGCVVGSAIVPIAALSAGLDVVGAGSMADALREVDACAVGSRDATHALQRVVDICATSGQIVQIPDGTYLINPDVGLRARNGSRFSFGLGVKLMALPSKAANYGILRIYGVNGVGVSGGSIVGERNSHLGKGGEWGFGIAILGSSDVNIDNVSTSECWGDGIYVGGYKGATCKNITLNDIVSVHNRRQGLSITSCDGILVENSTFASTAGTPPAAGIDIEPNAGESVSNVVIRNCRVYDNAGSGIQALNATDNVNITGCTIRDNGVYGLYIKKSSKGVTAKGNSISDNKHKDIHIDNGVNGFNNISNSYSTIQQ